MQDYAKQLAWLSHRLDKDSKDSPSRAQARARRELDLCLPEVEAMHLIEALDQLGWCESAGMGVAPIRWAEIQAWCALMQALLEPWEVQAIRMASQSYCSMATDPDAPEPFAEPITVSPFKALAKLANKPK